METFLWWCHANPKKNSDTIISVLGMIDSLMVLWPFRTIQIKFSYFLLITAGAHLLSQLWVNCAFDILLALASPQLENVFQAKRRKLFHENKRVMVYKKAMENFVFPDEI